MAHKEISGLRQQTMYARSDGNYSRMAVTLKTSAEALNDTIALARLYPGMRVVSVGAHVTDVHAGTDIDLGYTLDDGSGGDPDYWFDGESIAAVGYHEHRNDGTGAKPYLVKDEGLYLTATIKGAAIAASTEVEFEVFYTYEGNL